MTVLAPSVVLMVSACTPATEATASSAAAALSLIMDLSPLVDCLTHRPPRHASRARGLAFLDCSFSLGKDRRAGQWCWTGPPRESGDASARRSDNGAHGQ